MRLTLYNETDGRYLKTLYLPSSLRRIGNNVFCASITNIICDNFYFHVEDGFLLSDDNKTLYRYFGNETVVSIPQGVKYIKGGAFSEKDIEKVIIPDSVKGIGDNPLVGCSDIVEIISYSKRFKVIGNALYDLKDKSLIGCWDYQEQHIQIPKGTKHIGGNAFFGFDFQSIELPDSIEGVDDTAFYFCLNLSEIHVPIDHFERISNILPLYVKNRATIIAEF